MIAFFCVIISWTYLLYDYTYTYANMVHLQDVTSRLDSYLYDYYLYTSVSVGITVQSMVAQLKNGNLDGRESKR